MSVICFLGLQEREFTAWLENGCATPEWVRDLTPMTRDNQTQTEDQESAIHYTIQIDIRGVIIHFILIRISLINLLLNR